MLCYSSHVLSVESKGRSWLKRASYKGVPRQGQEVVVVQRLINSGISYDTHSCTDFKFIFQTWLRGLGHERTRNKLSLVASLALLTPFLWTESGRWRHELAWGVSGAGGGAVQWSRGGHASDALRAAKSDQVSSAHAQ